MFEGHEFHNKYLDQSFFQNFGQGVQSNGILGGAKWYDPSGSKAYGKLGNPGIIICYLIRGMHLKWGLLCNEGLYVLLCGAQSACVACYC